MESYWNGKVTYCKCIYRNNSFYSHCVSLPFLSIISIYLFCNKTNKQLTENRTTMKQKKKSVCQMAKALMDSTFDDILGNVFEIANILRQKISSQYLLLLKVQLALEQKIIKLSKRVTIKEILRVLYAFDAQPLW